MVPVLCEFFGFRGCTVEVSVLVGCCTLVTEWHARRCVITSRNVGHPSSTDAPLHPLKRRYKVAALFQIRLVSSLKLPTSFLSPDILLFYLDRVACIFRPIRCAITSPHSEILQRKFAPDFCTHCGIGTKYI